MVVRQGEHFGTVRGKLDKIFSWELELGAGSKADSHCVCAGCVAGLVGWDNESNAGGLRSPAARLGSRRFFANLFYTVDRKSAEVAMMDHVSRERRSRIMRAVPTKNTSVELAVRSILTGHGIRYRLHRKDLPGTPDIVLPGRGAVIFVNGCFWHGHAGCPKGRAPKTRRRYWVPKIAKNAANDRRHRTALRKLGWRILTVWQCELSRPTRLEKRLFDFLIHS